MKMINRDGKEVLTAFHDIHVVSHRPNIFGDEIACLDAWDFSKANLNNSNRVRAITQVASICYQNPKALESDSLYNRLAAESIGLPSSSFEFVPVLVCPWREGTRQILGKFDSNVTRFGEWIKVNNPKTGELDDCLLTNYRAMYYDYEDSLRKHLDNFAAYNTDDEDYVKATTEYYKEIYLDFFNDEFECDVIKQHFNVFLIKMDMPTRSQFVRHRVASYQELSRRYVSGKRVGFDFYISKKMKNVVSRHECEVWYEKEDGSEAITTANIDETTESLIGKCVKHYNDALEQGVKPEEARRIIPQAAYTNLWVAMTPKALENFFKLRLDGHAQWEIKKIAEAMKSSIDARKDIPEMSPERQAEMEKRLKEIQNGTAEILSNEDILKLLDAADKAEAPEVSNAEATIEDALDLLKDM